MTLLKVVVSASHQASINNHS